MSFFASLTSDSALFIEASVLNSPSISSVKFIENAFKEKKIIKKVTVILTTVAIIFGIEPPYVIIATNTTKVI